MPYYSNLGGDSGVRSYNVYENGISITFNSGKTYNYTYSSAGRNHIEHMKILAKNGQGLNSYINRNVRYLYE